MPFIQKLFKCIFQVLSFKNLVCFLTNGGIKTFLDSSFLLIIQNQFRVQLLSFSWNLICLVPSLQSFCALILFLEQSFNHKSILAGVSCFGFEQNPAETPEYPLSLIFLESGPNIYHLSFYFLLSKAAIQCYTNLIFTTLCHLLYSVK